MQVPGKLTLEALLRHLWSATDILRGSIDSSDYKDYILGLLFLKRVSDRFDEECEIIRRQGGDPEDPDEHQLFVPPPARWERIRRATHNIGQELNQAASALEAKNPKLEGVLYGIDFNDERKLGDFRQRDQVLGELVLHFSGLDLRNGNLAESGILGSAYNYLIERFADEGGKYGAEFSTPYRVVRLMVEILQPREGMRICDPACGSGGMLVESARYVEQSGGDPRNLSLYGQERNLNTWAMCKLNLLLHGYPDARIEKGDVIRTPRLQEGGELMSFDLVLSNPPASMPSWGIEFAEHDPWRRFQFGIPPRSYGDFAFLQHMISSLKPQGRMAVLISPGLLTRAGREGKIRQKLLESDLVEAIISLSAGALYYTTVPPAILVINRAKSPTRRGQVLFVNVPHEFEKIQYSWLAELVRDFREEAKVSRIVPIDQIASGKFSLKASQYIEKVPPGEWLENIADVLQSRGHSRSEHAEGVPVVQGRDLGGRALSKDDLARWPPPDSSARSIYVCEGDVLLQRIGEKPKAMLAEKPLEGALASDTIFVLRLKEGHRHKALYLAEYLSSPAGQAQMARSRLSVVVPTLSLSALRGLRIPLPDPRLMDLLDSVRALENDLMDRAQKTLAIRSKLFEAHHSDAFEAEVRRLSFDTQLLRASVAQAEDFEFQVRNFYPHMIAYRHRHISSTYDSGKEYSQQMELLEVLVIFLASVGLSLAAFAGKPERLADYDLGRKDLARIWERRVSLGHWMSIFRCATQFLGKEVPSGPLNDFAAILDKKLGKTLDALINHRNNDTHRPKERSPIDFRRDSEKLEEELRKVLKAALFFVQHPIRLVNDVSVPWNREGAVLNTLVYRGDHPSLKREKVPYHTALPEGHLYLELEPDLWLTLYPMLSVEEQGGERRTYTIDSFDAGSRKAGLKCLERGHEASPEHCQQVGKDFWTWLNKVFGAGEGHAVQA